MGRPRKEKTTCSAEGCERAARSKGLCTMHYQRQRDTGHIVKETCSHEDCKTESYATGLCFKHYQQKRNARIIPDSTLRKAVALKQFITYCPSCHSTEKPIVQAYGKEMSLVCITCGFSEKL